MHHLRAHTTSRNPVWRLLLVGLAFILVNLYITLRHTLGVGVLAQDPLVSHRPLSLDRLATALRQAAELLLGPPPAFIYRQHVVLS